MNTQKNIYRRSKFSPSHRDNDQKTKKIKPAIIVYLLIIFIFCLFAAPYILKNYKISVLGISINPYLISIFPTLWLVLNLKKIRFLFLNKTWFLIICTLALLSLFYLNLLECLHYPNYVYSHYHIILQNLNFFFGFLFSQIAILFCRPSILAVNLPLLLFLPLSLFLQFSVARLLGVSSSILAQTAKYQKIGVEKIDKVFSKDYQFFEFINSYTLPESKILIPPEGLPWRHTSDLWINRSLLYPRSILFYSVEQSLSLENFDYVVISSEEDGGDPANFHIWPDFNISSRSVIIYNFENNQFAEHFGNYDWQNWSQLKSWGLIKLR